MRIVVMPNSTKKQAVETGHVLSDKLSQKEIDCEIFLWGDKKSYTSQDYDVVFNNSDMIICIGGDGTFLHASRIACKYDIPVLGVNMGKLGFLTELDSENIDWAVSAIKEGNYTVDERMMIDISYNINGNQYSDFALNDMVISRAESSMINLDLSINNHFVSSYRGDGLIVASPTGSTAYSLSAGGPIVEPTNEVILVTPICPHSLLARPIVASPSSTIKVRINDGGSHKGVLSADGQEGILLGVDNEIIIKKSKKTAKVVRIMNKDFFTVLKEKINK